MRQPSEPGRSGEILLIALGSNAPSPAGGPDQTVAAALDALATRFPSEARASRLYRSPAFPPGSGPDFVNAAFAATCAEPPEAVLAALHAIEAAFRRERRQRWGARTLDLDLIGFGAAVRPSEAVWRHWAGLPLEEQARHAPEVLVLPHPRMQDRAFVLVPLAELAPDWVHPVLGRSVAALRDACPVADRAALSLLR